MDVTQLTCFSGLIRKQFRRGESLPSIPCIQDPGKGIEPRQTLPPPTSLPLAMPFQTGRIRRLHLLELTMWRSFLVSRRASSHPDSGGSRQPLDRQV
jgi:hypothetical protein